MEYRQDFLWKESTLSERVDEKIGKYLRENHPEYQKIRQQINEMLQQHLNVRAVFETDEAITLTPEEHEILNHYFNLESSAELIEREYHFYLEQSMMFSYGTMLASIRKSIMGIEGKEPQGIGAVPAESLTDHLVDIISDIRTDELEEEFQSESQEHPTNFYGDVDTLLESIYFHYTEYSPVETPEFKAVINPLEKTLRSLVETDEEADEYMNIVFELCCAYERQAYVEGIKLGARLTMELIGE